MAGKVRNLLERQGRFYARLVVPIELRTVTGKTELRAPLGPDRREANRRLPGAVAKLQDILANARRSIDAKNTAASRPLSEADMLHLHYSEELAADERARDLGATSESLILRQATVRADFNVPAFNDWTAPARMAGLQRVAAGAAPDDEIAAVIGWAIDKFRERGNSSAKPGTAAWRKLARTLASVEIEALHRSLERDQGNYAGQPKYAPLTTPPPAYEPVETVPLRDLFKSYLGELAKSGRGAEAKRRWTPVFDGLIKFLKHDDAGRVTRQDVIRWKDHLLLTLSAKTVRDSHLGSLRAVLQYGLDNDRLKTNVASGIKIRLTAKPQSREKGFTDDEAKALLSAAHTYQPRQSKKYGIRESSQVTAAKRWIPWLCAFTGARVAEMGQLRKEDVRQENGIDYLRITPDAGSVKTGQYRDVPLHPQLISLGFLDLVKAAPDGPLFYDAKSQRTSAEHPARHLSKNLSTWIRSLNIISVDVDPNHGWRHRFKTVARELGLDARVVDAIQGHAARTAGENYGDVTLRAKAAAITLLPV